MSGVERLYWNGQGWQFSPAAVLVYGTPIKYADEGPQVGFWTRDGSIWVEYLSWDDCGPDATSESIVAEAARRFAARPAAG